MLRQCANLGGRAQFAHARIIPHWDYFVGRRGRRPTKYAPKNCTCLPCVKGAFKTRDSRSLFDAYCYVLAVFAVNTEDIRRRCGVVEQGADLIRDIPLQAEHIADPQPHFHDSERYFYICFLAVRLCNLHADIPLAAAHRSNIIIGRGRVSARYLLRTRAQERVDRDSEIIRNNREQRNVGAGAVILPFRDRLSRHAEGICKLLLRYSFSFLNAAILLPIFIEDTSVLVNSFLLLNKLTASFRFGDLIVSPQNGGSQLSDGCSTKRSVEFRLNRRLRAR